MSPRDRTAPRRPPGERADLEHLLRLFIDTVTDYSIFLLDPTGRVVSWNRGAERMKGYTAAEIIGEHFSRFYPPEDIAAGKPARGLEIARTAGRYEEDGWRIRKDGSRFWANVIITAIRDAQGNLTGFGKVTRDMTERREAERARREAEERFHLLIENVVDYAIFMLDPAGRVVSWNAGAERIKGYRAAEILGEHFSRFYPPEDIAAGKPARMLAAAAAHGRVEDEGFRVRKDGSRFLANVVITALRDEKGELRGFAKVTRDITERRRAEEQARALLRLEEAARARGALISLMAHEIRTPLTSFDAYLEGLRRRLARGDPAIEAAFSRLKAQIERLAKLTDELGEAGRLESKQELPLAMRDEDLGEIVREAAAFHATALAARGGGRRLTLACDPGPMPIRAHRARIEQVIANLVENAVKYSPEGGDVELRLGREDGWYRLEVADHGIGIPEEDLPRLSERYFRAGNVAGDQYPGLGIGLAITRDVVARHGGSIDFRSKLGAGTTVTIRLPAAGRG